MASKNDITGDLIKSKTSSKTYEDNYDLIFSYNKSFTDSNGYEWKLCSRRCLLEETSPGIVSCPKKGCQYNLKEQNE